MPEAHFRNFEIYLTLTGRMPFLLWLEGLKDIQGRAKIKAALDRLMRGNFNRCRNIENGVFELKINHGPGYRVYFGHKDNKVILLLCGGNKTSQKRDIEKAKSYWGDYQCQQNQV